MLVCPVLTYFPGKAQASVAIPFTEPWRGLILLDLIGVVDVLRVETIFYFFFVATVMHVKLGNFWYLE